VGGDVTDLLVWSGPTEVTLAPLGAGESATRWADVCFVAAGTYHVAVCASSVPGGGWVSPGKKGNEGSGRRTWWGHAPLRIEVVDEKENFQVKRRRTTTRARSRGRFIHSFIRRRATCIDRREPHEIL